MKKAAVSFIFITLLLDVIGLGIIIPVMPGLIQELTGLGIEEAAFKGGNLLMVYALFQFLFSPVVGGLSDAYGRRPVLLLSLFGFGLDYLLLAVAPTYAWLFIGRILAGIFGASFTTCSAYIADVSTPEKKAQNFGLIGVAFGIGFILGPFIGGILGQYGTRIPFYAAAGVSLLNLLYGLFVLPESLSKENRRPFSLKESNPRGTFKKIAQFPQLGALLLGMFFIYIASHAVQSTWNYYTEGEFGWNTSMVGASLAFVGVLSAIVQGGLIRVIIPKLGQFKSIVLGFSLYIIGLVLLSFANQSWMLYAILVPYILGGIAGPAIQGYMSNQVDKTKQGELQGAISAMMSLALIVGPGLMTYTYGYFADESHTPHYPGAAFMLGAVFAVISLVLIVRAMKKNESHSEPLEMGTASSER